MNFNSFYNVGVPYFGQPLDNLWTTSGQAVNKFWTTYGQVVVLFFKTTLNKIKG